MSVFNTVCYTLSDALVWFVLGTMFGYVLFAPSKKRRGKREKHNTANA